jgi:hypothetical protein
VKTIPFDFVEGREESEDVGRWNMEQLVELGCDRVTAAFAALAGVKWHDVKELVDAGCSLETALEISA